jgi:hypothetical protein
MGYERGFVMVAPLRAALALMGALLLSACLVTPGTFTSSLDIRADRSFTFAYKGEVIASDMGKGMAQEPAPVDPAPQGEDSAWMNTAILWQEDEAPAAEAFDAKDESEDARMQHVAAALMKEKGFRSARYLGNRKFAIDYALSGTLTHAYLFPFNIDAQIVLPFVAIEMRGDDRIRVKAPGYAPSDKGQGGGLGGIGGGGMMGSGADDAAKALNGTFTLTTDAEIISQNQEDGPVPVARGRQIVWKATPMISEAPMAVLRVKP